MANANNYAANGMTSPLTSRVLGIKRNAPGGVKLGITGTTPVKPLSGFSLPAYLQVGAKASAAGFLIQAGDWVPAENGRNMTLTIATGSGTLTVTSNGFDITVTLASGGSHASTVVTAINAQFNAGFCKATLNQGSAGGTNVSALSKTSFAIDPRYPAVP